jgi:hypothetical protein
MPFAVDLRLCALRYVDLHRLSVLRMYLQHFVRFFVSFYTALFLLRRPNV